MNSRDIRVIIYYEYKLGHKATVAIQNINRAFGEGTINERTAQRWYSKFKSGVISFENEPRGKPEAVVDREKLLSLIKSNPHLTLRKISKILGVHHSTISRHLKAIDKLKSIDKVPPEKTIITKDDLNKD